MSDGGGFYDDPAVYDILHAPGTAEEVDGLERVCRRFMGGERKNWTWLEPACGTGRYLTVAAGRGIRAIGFDLNKAMVEYARRRGRRHGRRFRVFVGDMTDFADRIGPRGVSLAFNLINTLRHLPSDAAVLKHFGQMARVLDNRGVYAVGLSLAAYGREEPDEDVWTGARGRRHVRQVVQYLPPDRRSRRERVVNHLVVSTPRGEEHRDSSYELRSYDLGQWEALVGRSPFRIEATVNEWGEDVEPAEPGYFIFVLAS